MIADRMYFIKDGKISHKFSPEEMKSIRSEDSEFQDVAQGKSTIGADKSAIDKNVLIELREIEHFVKEKIEKISKKVHPM
jgi:ABC-type multidrug transport system ATPase subunit